MHYPNYTDNGVIRMVAFHGQLNMMKGEKMATLEEQTRAEVIVSINKGILKTILDEFKVHGDDPQALSIIVAALSMSIRDLDKALPGTKICLIEMLKGKL